MLTQIVKHTYKRTHRKQFTQSDGRWRTHSAVLSQLQLQAYSPCTLPCALSSKRAGTPSCNTTALSCTRCMHAAASRPPVLQSCRTPRTHGSSQLCRAVCLQVDRPGRCRAVTCLGLVGLLGSTAAVASPEVAAHTCSVSDEGMLRSWEGARG